MLLPSVPRQEWHHGPSRWIGRKLGIPNLKRRYIFYRCNTTFLHRVGLIKLTLHFDGKLSLKQNSRISPTNFFFLNPYTYFKYLNDFLPAPLHQPLAHSAFHLVTAGGKHSSRTEQHLSPGVLEPKQPDGAPPRGGSCV